MLRLLPAALALAAFMAAPAAVAAQDILGTVVDGAAGQAAPGVEVVISPEDGNGEIRTITDANGRFRVTVPGAGAYLISLAGLGYGETATTRVIVEPGEDLFIRLGVEPSPADLEPLRVTVTARDPNLRAVGFYERLEDGWGWYLEKEEIEAYPSTWPSHLLRRVPHVRSAGGRAWVDCRGGGSRVLVDGMDMTDIPLDEIVANRQIAAIEVYTTPETVPVELRRHRTCGVIAIWTDQ